MLSDVVFHGEYQSISTQSSNIDRLKLTALSVALPPLVAQAKTAATAHQEREEKSEQSFPCMAYAQRQTLCAYALLTAQGFFFRAEVPASTPLWLSVARKTGEVKGQHDVFGLP